jgi:Tfp pilus assembly PilM family ATPase
MSLPAVPWLHRFLPVLGRRLLIIDPGRRLTKVLVVDAGLTRPRVVHFQTLQGAPAEPLAAEEVDSQLEALFAAAGCHERVLVLPQYRAIAQVIDAPTASPAETQLALAREARRLSGLEEAALAFDARPLKPFGRYQNPYWLTLCKRDELDTLLNRFALLPEGAEPTAEPPLLAEVTTSGQALFAVATALGSHAATAVFVDLRANNSVLAILLHGQGVATTTIPTGSLQFHAALAGAVDRLAPPTDRPGGRRDLFRPDAALEPYHAALQQWTGEIRRALTEWIEDNPEAGLSPTALPIFLGGVGATQPGLLDFLNGLGPLHFEAWEDRATAAHPWPMADYLVPYGAALIALGRAPQAASLLPPQERAPRRQRRTIATLQSVNVFLLLFALALLAFGFSQKHGLIERKRALTSQAQTALQTAVAIDQLYRQVNVDFAEVHPILERQRQTFEALHSLAAVRAARTNDDFWYVLFADAASYASGTTGVLRAEAPTDRPDPATNAPSAAPPREFIVELCTPHEGERLRRILSDLVAHLKSEPLFQRVDSLPPERSRDRVPPNVAISNHVFGIAMEIADTPLPPPVIAPPPPATSDGRRPAPARSTSEPRANR